MWVPRLPDGCWETWFAVCCWRCASSCLGVDILYSPTYVWLVFERWCWLGRCFKLCREYGCWCIFLHLWRIWGLCFGLSVIYIWMRTLGSWEGLPAPWGLEECWFCIIWVFYVGNENYFSLERRCSATACFWWIGHRNRMKWISGQDIPFACTGNVVDVVTVSALVVISVYGNDSEFIGVYFNFPLFF